MAASNLIVGLSAWVEDIIPVLGEYNPCGITHQTVLYTVRMALDTSAIGH
jgi:hypothetical protein